MHWTAFAVSVTAIAKGEGARIPKLARSAFHRYGDDARLALFSTLGPDKRSVIYFLSPAVSSVAPELVKTLGATRSGPPPPNAPLVAGVVGTRVEDVG